MKIKLLFLLLMLCFLEQGFAQSPNSNNPYEMFGYEGETLKTPWERRQHMLLIPNQDTLSKVSTLGIAPDENKYYLFDEQGIVLQEDTLPKETVARFFAIDPLASKFPWNSTYAFSENRVIDGVELEGLEVYLLVWKSKDGETGHAGIAVTNYKYVEARDGRGYKPVPNATVTYFDLWPEAQVRDTELQDNVIPNYNKRVLKVEDLTQIDVSVSGIPGYVSENGEGRPADQVIMLVSPKGKTHFETTQLTQKVKTVALQQIRQQEGYNACNNNCSSFSQKSLQAGFPNIDGTQEIDIKGPLSLMYDDAKTVTPNDLSNSAANQPGSTVLKGKKQIEAKPYLDYFGK